MKRSSTFICLLVLEVMLGSQAVAGNLNSGLISLDPAAVFPTATFDPTIPTQLAVTGVAPGARPLRADELLHYFTALADASPRARLVEIGSTYEDRPLVVLAVSDEATVADLAAFQARHHEFLNREGAGDGKQSDVAPDKAVAWFAYGIHGDELSSSDAAALVAYWLVAGTDPGTAALRAKVLVLIDPCENPDGRTRYLAQTTSFAHRTANPDPDDLSHRGVWPWGRGNHYLFDMNRDWFTMLLPESVRAREVARWLPEMIVDSHEMGANSSYLFSPSRHPFNPHLPPNTHKWEGPVSAAQAKALDSRGFPYFTGEWNEEFFPGYGSSWAAYHGGIGILYEMSRTSGTHVRQDNGTLRTFAQAVEHQSVSSAANLTLLAANAAEILADHAAARRQAARDGAKGPVAAWVFPPDPRHPGRLERFARLLHDQGLEVQVMAGAKPTNAKQTSAKLTDARTGVQAAVDLPGGTLLVRSGQAAGHLARVLLDPHVPMDSGFFRDEREYLEKGKGSRLYDTTAWSLPLLRGIPAYWSGQVPSGQWQAWAPAEGAPAAGPLTDAPYYVIDGDPDSTPAVLADLFQWDVTVRVAEKDFTIAGRTFHRGALVLQREGNRSDLAATVSAVAAAHGIVPLPVGTADAEQGPDLGGSHYPVLVAPRVAVLTGMPVSPSDYGFVWHLLDQELDLRFSALDIGSFARADLSRYNVLVFPPVMGGTGMYLQVLGDGGLDRLRRWIEAGGTAIGIEGGARLLADKDVALTRARFRDQVVQEYPSPVWSIAATAAEASGRPTATGERTAPTEKGDKDTREGKRQEVDDHRESPYDVAPVLGAGARPFAAGFDQGTPISGEPVAMDDWLKPVLAPGQKGPEPEDQARADARLRSMMPQGVLLRASLDQEFWLTCGLPAEITVLFSGRDPLIAAPPAAVAAAFPGRDRLHLGGLLWPEAAARLAHTAYATREAVGRGQVILFADHPGFRRWLVESERLLTNAILLGPGLGTNWSAPW